jgi:hypothetical protein
VITLGEGVAALTSLNLTGGGRPKVEIDASFRNGWLKQLKFALGSAAGMSVALGAYEVFRSQPDKSFQLLQVWGPAFLIALVGIYVYGQITESQIRATRESFGELAASVRASSEALNRMAEMNGETARETQRLAMFAAQQGQEITERLDRQDEVLSGLAQGQAELAQAVKGVHLMLSREKAALDAKEKETGGRGDDLSG